MDNENKEAWKLLLDLLDNQQKEIVRLQEREILLLNMIMKLEKKNREQIKAFSIEYFKQDEEIKSPEAK